MKRKLDCIADTSVLIYPGVDMAQDEQTKRMRLSVQLAPVAEPMLPGWEPLGQPAPCSSHDIMLASSSSHGMMVSSSSHELMASSSSNGLMDMEGDEKDTEDDIPTTAEVLDSLRKVILWMSAQEDRNGNVGGYLQRLSEVEAYARGRQQFDDVSASHQRKITQYLVPRQLHQ